MAGIVDVMAGFAEIRRGFEQAAVVERQQVQRLQTGEQNLREAGDAAGVTQHGAEPGGDALHFLALIAAQASQFAADAARGHVGDDPVAHSGRGVIRRRARETAPGCAAACPCRPR